MLEVGIQTQVIANREYQCITCVSDLKFKKKIIKWISCYLPLCLNLSNCVIGGVVLVASELSRQLDYWLNQADLSHGPARAIIAP